MCSCSDMTPPSSRNPDGQIRAVIFDLDDTLFLETEFVLSGLSAVDAWLRNELAVTGFYARAESSYRAGIRGRNINMALEELGIPAQGELIKKLVHVYREHKPSLSLCPDAEWAIDWLRKSKRLGLITDGYLRTQRNKVAALGLENLFDRIIYTDEGGLEKWKPDPGSFQAMSSFLGCAPWECVYVADNPAKDFIAPRALGWQTVRVLRPGSQHWQVQVDPGQDATHRVRSLYQLPGAL